MDSQHRTIVKLLWLAYC